MSGLPRGWGIGSRVISFGRSASSSGLRLSSFALVCRSGERALVSEYIARPPPDECRNEASRGGSRAAGELTLGLMSGEERRCTRLGLCSSVGAGLLANAVDHSTSLLADTPLSRASPLPQLTSVRRKIHVHPRPPVGASLLAMAACQPTQFSQANEPRDQAGR